MMRAPGPCSGRCLMKSADLAARIEAFRAAAERKVCGQSMMTAPGATIIRIRMPSAPTCGSVIRTSTTSINTNFSRAAAAELSADYRPKRNGSVESMLGGFRCTTRFARPLPADKGIKDMIQNALTPSCYPDPEMKTATMDVGFYLCAFLSGRTQSKNGRIGMVPRRIIHRI